MNYFKLLWENYKYYKRIKNHPSIKLWDGKLPSQVYYKYPPDFTFEGKKVLNVGCGKCVYKAPNVVNLDITAYDGINLVWDLSKTPLPLETDSFDHIIANHCLEHIPNWFDCFKELCRIVKVGGMIEVWIPPISSDTAFSYRDHINRIGIASFSGCFNNRQAGTNLLSDIEYTEISDHYQRLELVWTGCKSVIKWWILFVPESLAIWMTQHLRNTVSEEGFKFIKRASIEGRLK